LIGGVQSSSTCKSFPKIFGGNVENTKLGQIDVFDDYLVMVGGTYDNLLTGKQFEVPYIALTSISTGGKYYWAKALTSMEN
jgi:hypothetical protein